MRDTIVSWPRIHRARLIIIPRFTRAARRHFPRPLRSVHQPGRADGHAVARAGSLRSGPRCGTGGATLAPSSWRPTRPGCVSRDPTPSTGSSAAPRPWRTGPCRPAVRSWCATRCQGSTLNAGRPDPSHAFCVGPDDLASVSSLMRSFSPSVRRAPAPVSANVRRKRPLIARQGAHRCASLQLGAMSAPLRRGLRKPPSRPTKIRPATSTKHYQIV